MIDFSFIFELLIVAVFAMGWWPCGACTSTTVSCTDCLGGVASVSYKAVFTGASDDTCNGCSTLNRTVILSNASPCLWRIDISTDLSDGLDPCTNQFGSKYWITWGVDDRAGNLFGVIQINYGLSVAFDDERWIRFQKNLGPTGSFNCRTITDLNIPFYQSFEDTGLFKCDSAAMTCEVTAL